MGFFDFLSPSDNESPSLFSGFAQADPADTAPSLSDRLGAGFLGFVNSPAPIPAIGNLFGGLLTGQRTDPAGVLQGSPPASGDSAAGGPSLSDRLGAGFLGFTNSPALFPAVGNLFGGLATGQRTDPAGIMQRILQERAASGSPPDTAGAAVPLPRPRPPEADETEPPASPPISAPTLAPTSGYPANGGLLNRFNAGFRGGANSPAPAPAFGNLFRGLATGQLPDPAGNQQRMGLFAQVPGLTPVQKAFLAARFPRPGGS